MSDTITIPLSDRAPVRINRAAWPVIADADWHSGEHSFQANEVAAVRVRQHADGRVIVYGYCEAGPGGMALDYRATRAGYLSRDDHDIATTIRAVADAIGLPFLAAECIADLPPEDLDAEPEPLDKRLADFGRATLATLDRDESWSGATLDSIADAARTLGLAAMDAQGYFRSSIA